MFQINGDLDLSFNANSTNCAMKAQFKMLVTQTWCRIAMNVIAHSAGVGPNV